MERRDDDAAKDQMEYGNMDDTASWEERRRHMKRYSKIERTLRGGLRQPRCLESVYGYFFLY